jgi:hypothetical protein
MHDQANCVGQDVLNAVPWPLNVILNMTHYLIMLNTLSNCLKFPRCIKVINQPRFSCCWPLTSMFDLNLEARGLGLAHGTLAHQLNICVSYFKIPWCMTKVIGFSSDIWPQCAALTFELGVKVLHMTYHLSPKLF